MAASNYNSIAVPAMTHDPAVFQDERVVQNMLRLDAQYSPIADYFDSVQADVKPRMRKILLNWMLEVLEEQQCDRDIFFLAVNYVDRFLSATCISRDDLQLVGTASMFIASKLREPRPLSADTLVVYTDNSVELRQLMMMEIMLVSTLKWDIAAVTPFDVLLQLLARLPIETSVRSRLQTHAYNVLTRFACAVQYVRYQSCLLAASSLASAMQMVHCESEEEPQCQTSRSACTGCAYLGMFDQPCSLDRLYDSLLQSLSNLLHLSKERISECRQVMESVLVSEASEDEEQEAEYEQEHEEEDADTGCQGDGEAPASSQSDERSAQVLAQDDDSLLSQCDVEMAGLLELNNNEPGVRPGVKSLDDSGFASDLSPPTRRFASTPTDCSSTHLAAR